ncbi:MAG: prepilin-type N-terminal cleavage/methylation domain-containing protein [Myxococcota bacterium]
MSPTNHFPVTSRAARAFSLVELLAVMVVLAIIGAIAIPAMLRTRESARQLMCLANQRELASLTAVYAEQNQGVAQLGHLWHYGYSVSVYDNSVPGFFGWGLLYEAGFDESFLGGELLACPARSGPDWLVANATNWPPGENASLDTEAHFAMRPMLDEHAEYGWRQDPGRSRWSDGPARLRDLDPSDAIIADAASAVDLLMATHMLFVNAAFADGHAEARPAAPILETVSHLPSLAHGTRRDHKLAQTEVWTRELDLGPRHRQR